MKKSGTKKSKAKRNELNAQNNVKECIGCVDEVEPAITISSTVEISSLGNSSENEGGAGLIPEPLTMEIRNEKLDISCEMIDKDGEYYALQAHNVEEAYLGKQNHLTENDSSSSATSCKMLIMDATNSTSQYDSTDGKTNNLDNNIVETYADQFWEFFSRVVSFSFGRYSKHHENVTQKRQLQFWNTVIPVALLLFDSLPRFILHALAILMWSLMQFTVGFCVWLLVHVPIQFFIKMCELGVRLFLLCVVSVLNSIPGPYFVKKALNGHVQHVSP